jgi:Flp pilus assembly protein CpaB
LKIFKRKEWLTMEFVKELVRRRLWVGILGVGIVAWEGHHQFSRNLHTLNDPRYLVAARSLKAGEAFSMRDFTYTFEKPEGGETYLTDQDFPEAVGTRYRKELGVGEYLTSTRLVSSHFSEKVPKGTRAYSFTLENRIPLRPGDRIDVFAKKTRKRSVLILENILVLQKREDSAQVSVAATSQNIELLENAQDNGKLVVALRNPNDGSRRQTVSGKRHVGIDVLTEGE